MALKASEAATAARVVFLIQSSGYFIPSSDKNLRSAHRNHAKVARISGEVFCGGLGLIGQARLKAHASIAQMDLISWSELESASRAIRHIEPPPITKHTGTALARAVIESESAGGDIVLDICMLARDGGLRLSEGHVVATSEAVPVTGDFLEPTKIDTLRIQLVLGAIRFTPHDCQLDAGPNWRGGLRFLLGLPGCELDVKRTSDRPFAGGRVLHRRDGNPESGRHPAARFLKKRRNRLLPFT